MGDRADAAIEDGRVSNRGGGSRRVLAGLAVAMAVHLGIAAWPGAGPFMVGPVAAATASDIGPDAERADSAGRTVREAPPESMTEVTLEIADSSKVATGGHAGWVRLREQPRRPAVVMRGGGHGNPLPASDLSGPVTLMIARSVRMVALSIPMNRMRSKPEVRMELRSERGTTLYAGDHKGSDFPEHASVLLSNHGRPLESGTYTLSISEKASKKPRAIRVKNLNQEYVVPPDTVVYSFEIRTAEPPR